MASDTCKKKECPWWKKYKTRCPMYMTTVWDNTDEAGVTKIVEDCAPKRNAILLMEYSSRAIGMQQDYEQQRNKYDQLIKDISTVVLELEKRNDSKILISEKI